MTSQAQITPAMSVQVACDRAEVVGTELRKHLSREIPAKVLLRKARDVVLLSGPTGAGKEKIATVAHEAARDFLSRKGDLVEVNCANLTGGLFESELFGYKKGAFTSADRDHVGLAQQAAGGTLVLDEIQSLEPQDQARLLRFLGEREYRRVGDDKVQKCDAMIILSTNRDLGEMVQNGEFRRDVLDRATAKLAIPSLYERRKDIGELAQTFAMEAARDVGVEDGDFYGLTRRARADVETAVIKAEEVSVRRLREIIRDCVFMAAADQMPEALESDMVVPALEREFTYSTDHRDALDRAEIEQEFDTAVARSLLQEIATRHDISMRALDKLVRAVQSIIDEMDDAPKSYRNVVERTNKLSKVALWLVSGAKTQAEFRKYFGKLDAEMPTKSVAHQIYYDVFPKKGGH